MYINITKTQAGYDISVDESDLAYYKNSNVIKYHIPTDLNERIAKLFQSHSEKHNKIIPKKFQTQVNADILLSMISDKVPFVDPPADGYTFQTNDCWEIESSLAFAPVESLFGNLQIIFDSIYSNDKTNINYFDYQRQKFISKEFDKSLYNQSYLEFEESLNPQFLSLKTFFALNQQSEFEQNRSMHHLAELMYKFITDPKIFNEEDINTIVLNRNFFYKIFEFYNGHLRR